jgi:hypothetical protein
MIDKTMVEEYNYEIWRNTVVAAYNDLADCCNMQPSLFDDGAEAEIRQLEIEIGDWLPQIDKYWNYYSRYNDTWDRYHAFQRAGALLDTLNGIRIQAGLSRIESPDMIPKPKASPKQQTA